MNLQSSNACDDRQRTVLALIEAQWGQGDAGERAERFFEEAAELAQAARIPAHRQHAIVAAVNRKPPGTPQREAGGVGFTLLGYCAVAGLSAEAAELAEIHRVAAMPADAARARHDAKRARGLVADRSASVAGEGTAIVLGEVAAVREEQRAKGFNARHDDGEVSGNLVAGAISFGVTAWREMFTAPGDWYMPNSWWPWELKAWKPGPPRRMLLKAIALLVAEIERLDRRAAQGEDPTPGSVIRRPFPLPLDLSTVRPVHRELGVRTVLVVCRSRRRAAEAVRRAGLDDRDKRRLRLVYADTPGLIMGRALGTQVVDLTQAEDIQDAALREVLGSILPRFVSLDELATGQAEADEHSLR